MPASAMAQVYSTMDVLINPSMGEGFGIPVLEAQSCGVPAIVTDFSAMQEVCGAGWHIGCRPYWTGQNSWQALPDVDDLVEALRHCYSQSRSGREVLSKRAREHALTYDVHRVFEEYWLPALRVIEQRFASQAPVTIPARKRVAA
jgi:glycosyltransferase involved in cell wall biosynthesis